jgi:CoA-dependent NAD(P)H sulfur oxidoreductase
MSRSPTIIVVGAVAAGMSAASQTKRRRPEARVVVLEQGQDVSYGACGMPYNIADPERGLDDLRVISPRVFREKRGLDLRLGHRVERIDRQAKRVFGHDDGGRAFELSYDQLILATGARPKLPKLPGLELPGVFPLRSLEDAGAIRGWLQQRTPETAVIIGGSYLGLELAEAMHSRGVVSTIIKRSPALLPQLPEQLDGLIRAEIAAYGVRLVHGEPVQAIRQQDGALAVQVGDRSLPAQMVLLATGYRPNAELGLDAGLARGAGGALAVDRAGRCSDPAIYAAGDCADAFHGITGQRVYAPRALRANRTGRIIGANVAGATQQIPATLGTAGLKVFGLEVASTGLGVEQARSSGFSPVSATIKARSRAHAYPGAQDIHVHLVADENSGRLLGGALVGAEWAAIRVDVVAAALHSGASVQQLADFDLVYSPPFAPAWDPLLTCANVLSKKLG